MMKENYCIMEIAIFQDTSHKKKEFTDPLTYINGNKMHRRVHKIQGAGDYFSKNGHVNFQNICLQRLCWHKIVEVATVFWIMWFKQRAFLAKIINRSFIMLNAIMENGNKNFTNISIFILRWWLQNMVYVTMISGKIKILVKKLLT